MDKEKFESILKGEITRRSFFKGSALALGGLAASAVLPGMAPEAHAQQVDRAGCTPAAWEVKPAPIPASEIKKTVNCDVLIIGAGISGILAAISSKENGIKNVVVIDKNAVVAARGGHITAFNSKYQQKLGIKVNYRQIIREWVRWAQGRVNEDLLWAFGHKSGAAMDWMVELVAPKGITVGLWSQYYKGPDYTEYPVTHTFEDSKTKERGNVPLVNALFEIAKEKGVDFQFRTKAAQFMREGNGPVTGVIAGNPGNYTRYVAGKTVIATGDYASNKELLARYAPIGLMVDAQIYFPNKCNTGDAHIMAMNIGAAMQKANPHACVIHLEAGAMSYSFLHVNALGNRFMNEDVNTQSKSCGKLFEPKGGVAWTIYDGDGLSQVQQQIDSNQSGGLFYGQMFRFMGEKWSMDEEKAILDANIKEGKVVTANTLDELAKKMGVPADEFKKTVARYNELAKSGNDVDYGKRSELLKPIARPPFYAGKLAATLLTVTGGLHTNTNFQVLDTNDMPIANLYVIGSAAGDFFAADYPTICPGIGHGRCVTGGKLIGYIVAGKSTDAVPTFMF